MLKQNRRIIPMKSEHSHPNSVYLRNAAIVDGMYDTITLPMKKDLKGHEYSFYTDIADKSFDDTNMYMSNQLPSGIDLYIDRIWVIILGEPEVNDLIGLSEGYFSLKAYDSERIITRGLFLFNMYSAILCDMPADLLLELEPLWYSMYVPRLLRPCTISSGILFKATLSFTESLELTQDIACRCWLHGKVVSKIF